VKDFFQFVLEVALWFVVIAGSLTERRAIEKTFWAVLLALVAVGTIAAIEKYAQVNLAAKLVAGMVDDPRTVSATFRHRILLGYALAMGFPLALIAQDLAQEKWQRVLGRISLFLLPAACYFSHSRGPWVGCALAAAVMGATGGHVIRKKLVILAVLGCALLVVRPGVWESISDLWTQSFDTSSIKGASANYRKELWIVAGHQVSKSAGRFLFGYGGKILESMDLSDEFDGNGKYGGSAGPLGYTSWDSEFAAHLMQFGFVGLGLELILFWVLFKTVAAGWREVAAAEGSLVSSCGAGMLVFVWAMTNVAIFNAQLVFLFWTLVAMVNGVVHLHASSPSSEPELEPVDGSFQESFDAGTGTTRVL
jgi:hypothetical protein